MLSLAGVVYYLGAPLPTTEFYPKRPRVLYLLADS